MIKDINKYLIINVIYNIMLVFFLLELFNLCNNKVLYIVIIIYTIYKAIFEMYGIYRGIYISKKYSNNCKCYSVDKLCGYCNDKTIHKTALYNNIINGIYPNIEKQKLIKTWEIALENYYSNKVDAIIFLTMNLVLAVFFGENALGVFAIVSIKVIIDGVKYSQEKNYLSVIKSRR